jgi:hypothetical protein
MARDPDQQPRASPEVGDLHRAVHDPLPQPAARDHDMMTQFRVGTDTADNDPTTSDPAKA